MALGLTWISMIKTFVWCGKEFIANRIDRMFCCTKCYNNYYQKERLSDTDRKRVAKKNKSKPTYKKGTQDKQHFNVLPRSPKVRD